MTPKMKKIALYSVLALAGAFFFFALMFLVGLILSLVGLIIKLDKPDLAGQFWLVQTR